MEVNRQSQIATLESELIHFRRSEARFRDILAIRSTPYEIRASVTDELSDCIDNIAATEKALEDLGQEP
jgi:hypothetical protein